MFSFLNNSGSKKGKYSFFLLGLFLLGVVAFLVKRNIENGSDGASEDLAEEVLLESEMETPVSANESDLIGDSQNEAVIEENLNGSVDGVLDASVGVEATEPLPAESIEVTQPVEAVVSVPDPVPAPSKKKTKTS